MTIRPALAIISIFIVMSFEAAKAQTPSLTGDWTGESLCAGNNSSCHDEKVVYHISVAKADSTKVKIAADKIVDGKPEWMGDVYLKYDPEKHTLTGDLQTSRYRGVWQFTVNGDIIEGTLTLLPQRSVTRRVKVKKDKPEFEGLSFCVPSK